MEERQDGNIIKRDIDEEMRTAYIDYAMSVIVSRALPLSYYFFLLYYIIKTLILQGFCGIIFIIFSYVLL